MDALRDETSVAEILGVRPATLQQWRWLGKGPTFIKVGGRIRYQQTGSGGDVARIGRRCHRRLGDSAATGAVHR